MLVGRVDVRGAAVRWRLPRTTVAVLVTVGFGLLLLAWLFATRPFGAPDEPSHYLRALGLGNGQLLGRKVPYALPSSSQPAWERAELDWTNQDTRGVQVPRSLAPPYVNCVNGMPDLRPGGCVEATPTGDYPPLGYLLPAAVLRIGSSATSAGWLARLGSAAGVVVFLALAVFALAPIGGWAMLGLLASVTPMVLFVGSVLNPSGLEIASCLAWVTSVTRIAVDRGRAPRWVWFALAVSGAVAILAWPLGPGFVLFGLLAVAFISPLGGVVRAEQRRVIWISAVLIAALLLGAVYAATSGLVHTGSTHSSLASRIHTGFDQLIYGVLPDTIGNFGARNVPLPTLARWVWWFLVIAMALGAMTIGLRRERAGLAMTIAVALGFPVVFYALIFSRSGSGLQGREVLPVLMVLPLSAGQIIQRASNRGRHVPASLLVGGILVAAVFQLFAWWINARHAAGVTHSLSFLSHPEWAPPTGWWVALVMAVGGATCIATSALATCSSDTHQPHRGASHLTFR